LGKKLAALRKARGLTQQQLADALGASQSVVAYYERRAENPSLEVLQKLATFYGVSVSELLTEGMNVEPRKRLGRPSALEERVERVRRLPRSEQARIIDTLDVAIEGAERRVSRSGGRARRAG
jgi:transcriptional regulator with XRE-family HTH domain